MTKVICGLFALMIALTMTGDTAAAIAASVALLIVGAWEMR